MFILKRRPVRGKIFNPTKYHRPTREELQVHRDSHASLQGSLNARFEVTRHVISVTSEEFEDVASHQWTLGEIGWVEHVDDTGRVELDEEIIKGKNKVLQVLA